jgi:2-aminoadipate transaminase
MTIRFALSHGSSSLKRSVMRDLLALTARPDMISFAGGLPADALLPRDQLQECIDTVFTRDGSRALQYGPPYAPLKEQIALYMQGRGVACSADEVFITNGSQQGLEIVSRLLFDSNATAVVEDYTFTGILQATRGHDADLIAVATHPQAGVELDALENAFAAHPTTRAAILIPDFHNPLGTSIPAANRPRIAELAACYQIPIIEDDPYSALRFEGEVVPPIKAYDESDVVIYLGSFSKMLAPALRLGWMVAPRELLPKLTVIRESIDLESSQLIQRAVAEFLARGYLAPHLAQLNAANRVRRDAMVEALARELGGIAQWNAPEGGLFLWLTLPEGADTNAIFHEALAQNVAFVPGHAFSAADCPSSNSLRLNFSNATVEEIDEGISRLAGVIKPSLLQTPINFSTVVKPDPRGLKADPAGLYRD